MFSDEILEKIFTNPETVNVPIVYQSAMIHSIEKILEDVKQNQDIELKDTAFHYFLHIEDYLGKGEQRPLDFAQEDIKEILINLKRVDFVNRVKEELYRQASEKNRIIYYYLNSDE